MLERIRPARGPSPPASTVQRTVKTHGNINSSIGRKRLSSETQRGRGDKLPKKSRSSDTPYLESNAGTKYVSARSLDCQAKQTHEHNLQKPLVETESRQRAFQSGIETMNQRTGQMKLPTAIKASDDLSYKSNPQSTGYHRPRDTSTALIDSSSIVGVLSSTTRKASSSTQVSLLSEDESSPEELVSKTHSPKRPDLSQASQARTRLGTSTAPKPNQLRLGHRSRGEGSPHRHPKRNQTSSLRSTKTSQVSGTQDVEQGFTACLCENLHLLFEEGIVPDLASWQGSMGTLWYNAKQVAYCRGHPEDLKEFCRELLRQRDIADDEDQTADEKKDIEFERASTSELASGFEQESHDRSFNSTDPSFNEDWPSLSSQIGCTPPSSPHPKPASPDQSHLSKRKRLSPTPVKHESPPTTENENGLIADVETGDLTESPSQSSPRCLVSGASSHSSQLPMNRAETCAAVTMDSGEPVVSDLEDQSIMRSDTDSESTRSDYEFRRYLVGLQIKDMEGKSKEELEEGFQMVDKIRSFGKSPRPSLDAPPPRKAKRASRLKPLEINLAAVSIGNPSPSTSHASTHSTPTTAAYPAAPPPIRQVLPTTTDAAHTAYATPTIPSDTSSTIPSAQADTGSRKRKRKMGSSI